MTQAELQTKIADLQKQIAALQAQLDAQPDTLGKIYDAAKAALHTHITLDNSVSPDLGCAEAVSYVLAKSGAFGFPASGFAGTSALWTWLAQHALQVSTPNPGDVVISPTGMSSKGTPHGHVGIVAQYGILSNDSDTGLFLEKYTLDTWKAYFGISLGFPVYFYRVSTA